MKNSQQILKKLTLAIAISASTMQLMAQGDAAQLIKAGYCRCEYVDEWIYESIVKIIWSRTQ
jgi:hypothetical protein